MLVLNRRIGVKVERSIFVLDAVHGYTALLFPNVGTRMQSGRFSYGAFIAGRTVAMPILSRSWSYFSQRRLFIHFLLTVHRSQQNET